MKNKRIKRGLALALGVMLAVQAPSGGLTPAFEAYAYTERAANIKGSSINVRSGPGTTYGKVTQLSNGASVIVTDEQRASDGVLWYQIRFSGSGGVQKTGYVSGAYVKFPTAYTQDSDFETYLNAQGFPESYKTGLRTLHAEHPTWVFTAQQTGLDWNNVIANESQVGANLVSKNSISSWKSTASGAYDWTSSTWPGFDGSAWVAASEDIIRYYMDPRNFWTMSMCSSF